jgi:hypothetical protein
MRQTLARRCLVLHDDNPDYRGDQNDPFVGEDFFLVPSEELIPTSPERKEETLKNDSSVAYGATPTLPMTVDNTGFMLDRLGKDCSPLQFLRELTQNALEAIEETPEGRGEIVWDVDWNRFDAAEGTAFKLACIDTGIGMTGEEMRRYINMLSSSKRVQSYEENFGVGAKVAAATRNHAGLIYLSWKDGVGSAIHLWRNPDTDQYGLRRFERQDGKYSDWIRIENALKPDQIKDHGTMVVLLGNHLDDNTMDAPKEAASPSRWVARYLNTRYFTFPKGITVKAREGWEYPRSNTDTNILRRVTGQKEYLDKHTTASGTVDLSSARAHWWILKDEKALTQNSGFVASSGHMAALYQNELYELATGRSGTARLQLFGVIFGSNRVVIYVEPKNGNERKLTSNTARTHLIMDEEPLPWADWASEFREELPEEIQDLMEEVTAGSTSRDHKQAIKDRLKQIRDLFKISRYRRTPTGDLSVAQDTAGGNQVSDKDTTGESRKGSGKSRGRGRAGDIYALFAVDDGEPGEEVLADIDPTVTWIRLEDGTRQPGDLEDRAAKYLADQNRILINADFRVFTDMIDRWHERYYEVRGARSHIEQVVQEWFEQALIETVLGVQALSGSQEWTSENIAGAWSEEALTAAVMQRYHIDNNVKRVLGAQLGSLKEKSA